MDLIERMAHVDFATTTGYVKKTGTQRRAEERARQRHLYIPHPGFPPPPPSKTHPACLICGGLMGESNRSRERHLRRRHGLRKPRWPRAGTVLPSKYLTLLAGRVS